jgi:hypothetical protein
MGLEAGAGGGPHPDDSIKALGFHSRKSAFSLANTIGTAPGNALAMSMQAGWADAET